jgi:predicted dehydrogenase
MSMSTTQQPATRVALVGYGRWGVNLARNLAASAPIGALVMIADGSEERRAAAAAAFPAVRTVASIEEVLSSDDVQAVVLATPARTHSALAVAALEAGRHVLVEKPLAMTSGEADAVVDAAKRTGLTAAVGHTFLYSTPVRRLRQYIAEGALGEIRYLYSQRLNLGVIRNDCNALWNFAPHDVSILMHLLQERPSAVRASSIAFLQPDLADVVFAQLHFPSGVHAHVHVSWIDPRKVRQMTVVGSEKMAVYDDVSADAKLTLYDSGAARYVKEPATAGTLGEFQWRTRTGDVHIPHLKLNEPLGVEVAEFLQACRSGSQPLTDAAHGADVVRILEALENSATDGGTSVDLSW